MYRPIPELHPQEVDCQQPCQLVPVPGMTHFAPVTMATRPCKSSRSRSGEIFDVALPMASTGVVGKDGKIVSTTCCSSEGFMNRVEPRLFATESIPYSTIFSPRVLPNSSRTRVLRLIRKAHTVQQLALL
jgi:hypothetical protein